MGRRFWLLKSDPDSFGLEHLAASPGGTTRWDGIRSYQARNYLRDEVREGDGVLFYHSRIAAPAVVGTATVVRAAYPDPTQFDAGGPGYDPRSPRERPRWYAIDVRLDRAFPRPVPLAEIRATPGLGRMVLVRTSRLSVQPVTPSEWDIVSRLARGRKQRSPKR